MIIDIMNRHIYTMRKPASRHGELWREALPLGNGLTDALVTGAIADESIPFNRHDLWHGKGDGGAIPDVTETFQNMRAFIDREDYVSTNTEDIL